MMKYNSPFLQKHSKSTEVFTILSANVVLMTLIKETKLRSRWIRRITANRYSIPYKITDLKQRLQHIKNSESLSLVKVLQFVATSHKGR